MANASTSDSRKDRRRWGTRSSRVDSCIGAAGIIVLLVALAAGIGAGPVAPRRRARRAPDLATRVADLEAYITNGDAQGAVVAGPRPQRLDDDLRGAGALHDPARPGAVLRRPRAPQERPLRHGAVPRLRRPGHHPVVGRSATAWSSRRGTPFLGGTEVRVPEGRDLGAQHRLRRLGLAERVRDVPADVRDHHARPDRRRHRRAHEVLGASWSSSRSGCSSSTSRWRTWSGASTAS